MKSICSSWVECPENYSSDMFCKQEYCSLRVIMLYSINRFHISYILIFCILTWNNPIFFNFKHWTLGSMLYTNEPICECVVTELEILDTIYLLFGWYRMFYMYHCYGGVSRTNGVWTVVFQTRVVFQEWCFKWGYTSCLQWYFKTPPVVLFSNSSGVLHGFSKRQWCFV